MSKKKIVSIEDRIPKLKQARKKKANRRLIIYLSIFFFLLAIVVYLQSPLSHVKTIKVAGNTYLTEEEVIELSQLTTDNNIWMINKDKIKKTMSQNAVIESVKIKRIFPRTVELLVTEYERVGYVKNDDGYFPILGNGNQLSPLSSPKGDAPVLFGFTEKTSLNQLTNELLQLPASLFHLISEIHWQPEKKNQNKIILYMNDGFIVEGTIRGFAEKMRVYPSIVSQLDPKSEGIIHIGVGAYFEDFTATEDAENEDLDEEAINE